MTDYSLTGRAHYWRRNTAAALLYAMFQYASQKEKAGENVEFALTMFSPHPDSNDYLGVVYTSPGSSEMADVIEMYSAVAA